MDPGEHDPEPVLRRRVEFPEEFKEQIRQVIIEEESKAKRPKSYVLAFLEAGVWVAIASLIIIYTDFFEEVQTSPYINRFYFNLGLFFISAFSAIGAYAIVWLSWIKGDENWERVPSLLFPTAAFCILAGLICTTIGLWSLWSWLSPFIVFFVMMGFCMPLSVV
ncbi:transmembrane protein 128-like [Sycon ciliatum]|uniref:transmembrane protein 128-like n=1 Tax=Sycon ciliatum TaxID=27933 RepID=UPI0020A83D80|eukprot:scpid86492/ scgid34981/ Transmembrane protein 128